MSDQAKQRSISELKAEVARLEQAVERFECRVEHARWMTAMLDRAKAPHPRFPFWEWAHKNFPSEAVQRRVERVVGELNARVIGNWEPDPEADRDIPGVPSELLYVARPPTISEVYELIKAASGFTSNAKVVEMFQMMKANGLAPELTDFVLSAVDE